MDEIILKYLKGEMDIDDQHRLSKWLEEDPKNREILRKLELFWKSTDSSTQAAKSKIWIKLLREIEQDEAIHQSPAKRKYLPWYAVAAAVALLVTASFIILNLLGDNAPQKLVTASHIEKVCPPGMKIRFELADGSFVKLNSGSSIKYPKEFSNSTREIILTGEAFFDIARDESKPFIIHTADMHVQVLGTSFNVQAYKDESMSEVAVRSGKVRVVNETGQSIDITRSERAILDKHDTALASSKIQSPDAVFGWMEGRLVFEDEDLETVLRKVARWYGVSISSGKLNRGKDKITFNCKDCSIQEIMESLSYSYDFKYEINGKSITIN